MIFKVKTAKRTQEICSQIERSTHLKPYTLVKHAIAWSLKDGIPADKFNYDTNGQELNRQTIMGEYEEYFKVLIEQVEGRCLTDEEFFPKYVKAHIDRGAIILESRFKHAGNMDKYVLQTLGVGDTV